MKRTRIILSLSLLIAFTFFLSACSNNMTSIDKIDETENNEVTVTQEVKDETEDDDLNTTKELQLETLSSKEETEEVIMNVHINGSDLKVRLDNNSSALALIELLEEGPLELEMDDYGNMEKVGSLGHQLPTNDERITTKPGDVILYQGHNLVIYHKPNTWSFTKLGEVLDMEENEIRQKLGEGPMQVILSLD